MQNFPPCAGRKCHRHGTFAGILMDLKLQPCKDNSSDASRLGSKSQMVQTRTINTPLTLWAQAHKDLPLAGSYRLSGATALQSRLSDTNLFTLFFFENSFPPTTFSSENDDDDAVAVARLCRDRAALSLAPAPTLSPDVSMPTPVVVESHVQ